MGSGLLAPLLLAASASAFSILYLVEDEVCEGEGSSKWICRSKNDCPGAATALSEGWKPKVCSYKRTNEAILCCPPSWAGVLPNSSVELLAWSGSWDKLPSGGWNLHKSPSITRATPAAGQSVAPTSSPPGSTPTGRPSPFTSRPPKKPTEVMFLNFSQEPHPVGSPAAKAQEMCKIYSQYVNRKVSVPLFQGIKAEFEQICGKSTSPLVFGGEDAMPYEFPHMARIGYGDEKNIEYGCGGSLISERYILSAAHCATVFKRNASWANLGDYDLTTDRDIPNGEVVTVRIVQRIIHPDYDKDKNWYNDIALFKLEKDLTLGVYVRPACLNTKRVRKDKSLLVSGWGLTKSTAGFAIDVNNAVPTRLQKAELKVIPTEDCNKTYNTLPDRDRAHYLRGILPYGQMCAGGVPGKAICGGDSGGPLQAVIPPCLFEIVGVTSFGVGCKSHFPGVYTNVVDYLPWIVTIVWG